MTDEDIKAIRERLVKATSGPWEFDQHGWLQSSSQTVISASHDGNFISNIDIDKSDAEFIAHARQDIPKLLETLKLAMGALTFISSAGNPDCQEALQKHADEALEKIEKI